MRGHRLMSGRGWPSNLWIYEEGPLRFVSSLLVALWRFHMMESQREK